VSNLAPGVIALALYGSVWFVARRVQVAKLRHVDRLTILEEFEKEISRQK
jgi:hypothetical protein